jgi:hypothetical protein
LVTVKLPLHDTRSLGGARKTPSRPTVVLLAANPMTLPSLRLDEECRIIEESAHAGVSRKPIRFRVRWAAHSDHLLLALNEDRPSVLQFSGHGSEQGLCFQAADGSAQSIGAEALATVVRAAGRDLSVVVLSACYSEVQAVALAAHVPCVVGWPSLLDDKAARVYAGAFYRALAFGSSVANAHEQGLAALELSTSTQPTRDIRPSKDRQYSSIPRLLTRPGIDADNIYLVRGAGKTQCTMTIHAKLQEFDPDMLAQVTKVIGQLVDDDGSLRLTVTFPTRSRKVRKKRTK